MAYGLMFHHFWGQEFPEVQGAITANEFLQIINYIGKENILNADEWLHLAKANKLADNQCCITFDDGLLSQYKIAFPILKELGIKAFWFIYTSILEGKLETLEIFRQFRTAEFDDIDSFYQLFFLEVENEYEITEETITSNKQFKNYLSSFSFYSLNDRKFRFIRDKLLKKSEYDTTMWKLIKKRGIDPKDLAKGSWLEKKNVAALVSEGHMIGLHTHTHPTAMASLSANDQRLEYTKNSEILTSITGEKPVAASYPCGSYNQNTIPILHDLDVEVAFRVNMDIVAEPNLLEIPREDHMNILRYMKDSNTKPALNKV